MTQRWCENCHGQGSYPTFEGDLMVDDDFECPVCQGEGTWEEDDDDDREKP